MESMEEGPEQQTSTNGSDLKPPANSDSEQPPNSDLEQPPNSDLGPSDLGPPPNSDLGPPPNSDLGPPPNSDLGPPPNSDLGPPPNSDSKQPRNSDLGPPLQKRRKRNRLQPKYIAEKIAFEKETVCEYIDQLQGILAQTRSLVTSPQAEEELGEKFVNYLDRISTQYFGQLVQCIAEWLEDGPGETNFDYPVLPIPPVKSPPILRCDWVRAPDSEEEYAYDDPHDFIKEPPNRDEYHTLKVIVDTQRMEPQQVFLDTLNMELLHGPMEYYPRGPSTNYAAVWRLAEKSTGHMENFVTPGANLHVTVPLRKGKKEDDGARYFPLVFRCTGSDTESKVVKVHLSDDEDKSRRKLLIAKRLDDLNKEYYIVPESVVDKNKDKSMKLVAVLTNRMKKRDAFLWEQTKLQGKEIQTTHPIRYLEQDDNKK